MYALNLKKLCKEKNITLTELALRSGIPQPSLSRYASGKSDITLRQLNRLTISLGVELKDMLKKTEVFITKYNRAIVHKEKEEQNKEKEWVSRLLWLFKQHYLKVKK